MTVKLTFEFETNAEAIAFLEAQEGGPAAAGGEPAKRGPGRPRKSNATVEVAPEVAAPPAQAPATAAAAPATPAAAAAPAADFKAVADAISSLAEADHPAAKALLGRFGVGRATDLKPDQYGAIVAEARKLLDAGKSGPASLI